MFKLRGTGLHAYRKKGSSACQGSMQRLVRGIGIDRLEARIGKQVDEYGRLAL